MADRSQEIDEQDGDIDREENPYPSPEETERDITKLEIDVREDPFQVSAIVQKIDKKQLVLSPSFQRNEAWKPKQRSEFIESILLNYPLPPLFFNQDKKGRYIVVDGQQRSSSVYRFVKNEYALTGLERLGWLNNQKFKDLDPVLQARIEDRKLNCYVLKPSVPMSVVYDIFARINRSGMSLNRQEIRHGLYQGKSTELLKELAATHVFNNWLGHRLTPERMRNEEACLRCIAFAATEPQTDYKDDMDKFLEASMGRLNLASDKEIDAIKKNFERVFSLAKGILGENAFRIPLPNGKGRGQLNIAVMESIYRFFALSSDEWLTRNNKKIEKNYNRLIRLPEYLAAVRQATGDTAKVRIRFRLANQVLGEGCAE